MVSVSIVARISDNILVNIGNRLVPPGYRVASPSEACFYGCKLSRVPFGVRVAVGAIFAARASSTGLDITRDKVARVDGGGGQDITGCRGLFQVPWYAEELYGGFAGSVEAMDIQPICITLVVLERCSNCCGGENDAGEERVMHGL